MRRQATLVAVVLVAACTGEPEDHSLADAMSFALITFAGVAVAFCVVLIWAIRRLGPVKSAVGARSEPPHSTTDEPE